MRVQWTKQAERQLKEIFDYYSSEAGSRVAGKMVTRIIDRVSMLENNPLAGPIEELLNDYPEQYRYLVESHYKIIYWTNQGVITISAVFDCRQNPKKMEDEL